MRLSDIVSHLDMHVYAEIGLVLFGAAFIVVAARTLLIKRKDSKHLSALPLQDDDAGTEAGER